MYHNHLEKGGGSKEGNHRGINSFPRIRGKGRGGEVRCYAYGKTIHIFWECLEIKKDDRRGEAHIFEDQKNVEEEVAEGGRNLMMRKFILKPEKEAKEPVQRTNLFRTTCKTKDRFCKMIIDSGSIDNLVST